MADPYRRFLVSAIRTAKATGLPAVAAVLINQHAERPGTALGADFPMRAKLALSFYTAVEDLEGADADELIRGAGLTAYEAKAVIGAMP